MSDSGGAVGQEQVERKVDVSLDVLEATISEGSPSRRFTGITDPDFVIPPADSTLGLKFPPPWARKALRKLRTDEPLLDGSLPV